MEIGHIRVFAILNVTFFYYDDNDDYDDQKSYGQKADGPRRINKIKQIQDKSRLYSKGF